MEGYRIERLTLHSGTEFVASLVHGDVIEEHEPEPGIREYEARGGGWGPVYIPQSAVAEVAWEERP